VQSRDDMKRAAAEAALEYASGQSVLGVGSGTTVDAFIDALAASDIRPRAVVAASVASEERLVLAGFSVANLQDVGTVLPVYVDGADEADPQLRLIKGAGGAMLREKALAEAAERFVCVVDAPKLAKRLGGVPVPVEIMPLLLGSAIGRLEQLGGVATVRRRYLTEGGNAVVDVAGLPLDDPLGIERTLDDVPGVVASGVFAVRPADVLIVGMADGGVRVMVRP
jgi:ribose 5-phosphate isomerase A